MAIVISGNGIDMWNNPVSNASKIEVQQEQVSPFSFTIPAIIPNNSTYMLHLGGSVINYWSELR